MKTRTIVRSWRTLSSAMLLVALFYLPAAAARSVVTVPLKSPYQIEQIVARGIEILAFTKHGVDVYADEAQVQWLLSQPYPVSVAPEPLAPAGTAVIDANLGQYHTYAELDTMLTNLVTTYPAIAQRSVIGTSIEGRSLFALKISDNVAVDENEPEVLYMGNHHARELMSVEIPLRFAAWLLQNYGVDSEVTGYVNEREIWFVPMVNPDGHYYVQQFHAGSPNGWWRKNRRDNGNFTFGVDLNRNYGYQWGYDNIGSSPTTSSEVYRGTGPFSEPEALAIKNFVNAHNFTAWFSYHSYGELLLYPWGYYYGNTPDHAVFKALGDSLVAENGYLAGNSASGAIYITNGSSDDWGYGVHAVRDKVFAFTPEVNSSAQGGFGPAETVIQPTFDLLLPMNLKLLRFAANPYQVVGPWKPTQYDTQSPYGNGVTRVSWTAADAADPNPTTHYEIETCLNPSFYTDTGWSIIVDWVMNGFSYTNSGFSGGGYYSGNADQISNSMEMKRPFVVDADTDTLRFDITYDIESNYDYGYVDVSTDGGSSWTPIQGNITTSSNPFGNNRGHGITGSSGGWVAAIFPLTAYAGQEIMLRFAYVTDQSITGTGYRLDNISPVATCASTSVTATANADTTYDHVPPVPGVWSFRVRAIDAEDQASAWSNSRERTVTTTTEVGDARVYRTDLGANYPNPFNPSTQIPYVVGGATGAAAVRVELTVYSVTGARVATLVNDLRQPGTYVARWNGTGQRGEPVPTGVYFARLAVDGAMATTRKMVMLK